MSWSIRIKFLTPVRSNEIEILLLGIMEMLFILSFMLSPKGYMTITNIAYSNYLKGLCDSREKDLERTLKSVLNNSNEYSTQIKINLTRNELAALIAKHINSGIKCNRKEYPN